jgi:prepilin-type N-terminal cleavage/methylation domain-containing protein
MLNQNTKYQIPNTKYQNGFTLFELIVVITITAILAAITVAIVPTVGRGRELEAERDKIVAYLRHARQKAVSQEEGRQWGVRFDNTQSATPKYMLFSGASFSSAAETIFLSSKVQFNDPSGGNTRDIVFVKITGTTTAASVIVALRNTGQTKTVSVNSQGVVTSD